MANFPSRFPPYIAFRSVQDRFRLESINFEYTNMKRTLYLLMFLAVLGCSKSDDDNPADAGKNISPPDWIIGTWFLEDGPNVGYSFRSDNFCLATATQKSCFKELVKTNKDAEITESKSEDSYKIDITLTSALSYNYEFKKLSPTKLQLVNSDISGTDDIYIKQ